MARIVFYCRDEREHLDIFEYYRQDIEALRDLGHEVVVCTRYREIPWTFDAMFIWWWTYALVPVLWCRLRGKPSLVTGVFNFRFPKHMKGRDYHHRPFWQRALISAATRLATLNLFIDEAEQRACAEYFGLHNARAYPCCVQSEYLQGPGPERELALFNLAWSGKENLVRKGIPELLDALKLLADAGIRPRVYLGGPRGDGTDGMLARIEELGLSGHVTWLGPLERSRKIELQRRYEIYVQPSHFEGFGLATCEAMGGGACVITCDVGAVRSVVGDEGIYVPPGSAEGLASGIRRALEDAALRASLQRGAHDRARTVFAPEKKLDRLRQYLAEAGLR